MCNAMASVAYDEMKQWTVDDVLAWLQKNNFTEFQEFVSFERICGDDFLKLDRGRLSNCSVSKSKKDSLLKRLKDIEKERTKMLKNMKKNQNSSNTRQIPPVKAHPSVLGRTAPPPPKPEDDAEDDFDDDDEWEEEQGVYDNDDQVIQPTKGHRSDPPPPIPQSQTPNDGDSDEDYEKPENPGPTGRAPPPIPNDDDDLYERANQAKIPGRTIPPPLNYAAPQQRSVPPAPSQGPSVLPPRGGRAPVAPPSSRPMLYEEGQPVSPPPPPRKSSPPPPIPRPSGPVGPKTPVQTAVRTRAPLPVPAEPEDMYEETDAIQPQEIYEHPDDNEKKPPFIPPVRDIRNLPPRPASELYENPPDQPRVPDYESFEDLEAKRNQASSGPFGGGHRRPPAPVPAAGADEMYEETDTSPRAPPPNSRPPQPPVTQEENNYEETEKFQISSPPLPPPGRAGPRAAPPRPLPDPTDGQLYEETDAIPQINDGCEEQPPPKPEKIQMVKNRPGVGLPGIGMNSVAVREAKDKLRKAIPKELSEAKVFTDKPIQVEAMGVGGIKELLELKTKQQRNQTKPSKVSPMSPPSARPAVALPPVTPPTNENNAPGAPEPPRRRPERPLPGPPGGPPDTVPSPAIPASPAAADPSDIRKQPWYFGDCVRETANQMLTESAEDGTYLVRDSKGSGQPYTLGIFYKGDIFNISIRKRPDGKFALGTEKPDEHIFETINDMIRFHRNNAIEVSKTGVLAGRVKLLKVAEKL